MTELRLIKSFLRTQESTNPCVLPWLQVDIQGTDFFKIPKAS